MCIKNENLPRWKYMYMYISLFEPCQPPTILFLYVTQTNWHFLYTVWQTTKKAEYRYILHNHGL